MSPSIAYPLPLQGKAEPLKYSGSLDKYEQIKSTPAIGTEFPTLQLSDVLKDEAQLRDLAILVAERGVVFFRNQDLDTPDQEVLAHKLGRLTNKPKESSLHIHPYTPADAELGDKVLAVGDSLIAKPIAFHTSLDPPRKSATNIHSDVTYEKFGPDFGILKLVQVPEEGGDTIFFSGYSVYDKLSQPFRDYLETLTAHHSGNFFHENARKTGFTVRESLARGHPENIGGNMEYDHPLIRTNPITGWKSVFISHNYVSRINGVGKDESDLILQYLFRLYGHSHDLSVRFKWGLDDIAIWDNRSTNHAATFDVQGLRKGNRTLGIGEQPFIDPQSKSRTEALGQKRLN